MTEHGLASFDELVELIATSEDGEVVAANAARCPKTLEALRDLPLARVPNRSPSILFSLLQPGAHIFVGAAQRLPDGTLETARITVGKGIAPPM